MIQAAIYTLVFNRKKELIQPGRKYLVQIRVYYKRKSKFITTGIYLKEDQWNDKNKVVQNHPKALDINIFLRNKIEAIQTYEHSTRNKGREFTFEDLNSFLLGNDTSNFLDFMEAQINSRLDISQSTRVHHSAILNRLKEFGKIRFLLDLTYDNIVALDNWLNEKGLNQSTLYTSHKVIKLYVNRAIKSGIIKQNATPYLRFRPKKTTTHDRKYLTKEELEKVENQVFDDRIGLHRDLFLFMCYTGLAYADATALTSSNLIEINGEFWIIKKRLKTDQECIILLLPKPLEIINKYNGFKPGRLLPYISNQKMNSWLKLIQVACGINKELTTHVARHTFATTVTLANGISLEVLQKMLGHSTIQTTEVYAKLLNSRMQKEMNDLKKNLEKQSDTKITQEKKNSKID